MVKGVNRTIIEVPHPANRYFERALLFVRPQLEDVHPKHLQKEADALVAQFSFKQPTQSAKRQSRRYSRIKRWILHGLWWCIGAGCSAAVCLVIL